jgi:serine/threonine protein kinase
VLGLLWRGVRTRRLLDVRDLARLCSVTLALIEHDVTVLRQLPSLPQLVCARASDSDLRAKVSELLVGIIDALGKPAVAKTTLVSQLLPPPQAAECWHALLLCAKKDASFAQLLPTFQTLLRLLPSLTSHMDASGCTLLHMSARANALEVCQLLVEKGASLLTADKKGLTAVQHAPVLSHGPVHAFLVERQRLASMYRGRFEIDHTRAPLVSAHGKVKFAFESVKDNSTDSVGSTSSSTAMKISVSPPSSAPSASAAAASTPRLRVVLKFADNAAEFASEKRIYEQIGDSAGGQYLPRLLAVFEPLPSAPAGSDDAMWCLALEGGTENLRAKMVRKGSSGFPTMDMLPVASSALAALRFLHRRGLVHGDIKPENLLSFADDYRLIDFDAARQVDAPLSLAFTAHYTPPEQAKRVLAARQAEREGKVLAVPKLLADGSYDVWCLGAVLFEMRAGRTLFGNSNSSAASTLTGDKERDVDAILTSICAATDESIAASIDALKDSSGLSGNGIEHPLRENEASFLKKMLRVRVGESKSSCRFSVRDLVVVLQEEILNGMTSTQQTRSWEAKLQGINDTVVATHSDVRSANNKLTAMDQQQQKAEQHLRQIKAGVHMVAARVDEVGVAVAEVLKGQEGMNVSLGEILTLCNKLEEQAQQTLRAVFDVHESCDMPRLFSLLPDQLDAARKPMAPAEWHSLKERFSHAWDDVSRQAQQAARDVMPFHYFRLTFICEAADRGGGCTAHAGYVVKQPTQWMLQHMLPALKVANTLLKAAAIVGKAAGFPLPLDGLPFVDDVKDAALWNSLDSWYAHAGGQTSGPPAAASSSSAATSPASAFHDAYVACHQLLEANGIATGNKSDPLGGLHRVQAKDGGVRWVCQSHAQRCFPHGHEIDVPAQAIAVNAANSSSFAGELPPAVAVQIAQLQSEASHLRSENEQLQRRLAESNPQARTAKVAPETAASAAPTTSPGGNEGKKKDSGCVIC